MTAPSCSVARAPQNTTRAPSRPQRRTPEGACYSWKTRVPAAVAGMRESAWSQCRRCGQHYSRGLQLRSAAEGATAHWTIQRVTTIQAGQSSCGRVGPVPRPTPRRCGRPRTSVRAAKRLPGGRKRGVGATPAAAPAREQQTQGQKRRVTRDAARRIRRQSCCYYYHFWCCCPRIVPAPQWNRTVSTRRVAARQIRQRQ